jgi:hypothetical protein
MKYKPPGLNLGNTGSFAQRSSDDVVSDMEMVPQQVEEQ